MKRLVIAPHGDDEVFGCGGILAKYSSETVVCIVAELSPIRAVEAKQARDLLGYRDFYECGFQDGHVGDDMKKLVSKLDEVLMFFEPEIVYVPSPGSHQDHMAVYEGAVRAARLSMSEVHWSPRAVYVYEVAAYDIELFESGLRYPMVESLTDVHVQAKARAMAAYRSQQMPGDHPVNGTVELARSVGASVGVAYGERFAVLRDVR
jgi:LmbE family N-acetylglucosaminyl deacetylase